jgi:hypothetical protein
LFAFWKKRYAEYTARKAQIPVGLHFITQIHGITNVYSSKGEQIMVLSHKKIEEIAIGVMKDFNTFFFGAAHETQAAMPSATL